MERLDRRQPPARVIAIAAPSMADPSNVLFAEGIGVRNDDELHFIETPGNATVNILTKGTQY